MSEASIWADAIDVELTKSVPGRSEFLVFASGDVLTPLIIQHVSGNAFYVFANGTEHFIAGPGAATYIVARGNVRVFLDPQNDKISAATARIKLASPTIDTRAAGKQDA